MLTIARTAEQGWINMRLIDVEKLKQYIDDCKFCEKCDMKGFMCNEDCELPDCVTPQWERVLNEQPTVEAVPISFIEKRIEQLKNHADYEFEANGGYVGGSQYRQWELECLLNVWAERKEE